MQVLVALAVARGTVTTRAQLLEQCWNGVVVGDDSLNRAISEARRSLQDAGSMTDIQTVPRVGYRVEGATFAEPQSGNPTLSRRNFAGIAALGSAVAAASAWHVFGRAKRSPEVQILIDRARQALRDEYPDSDEQGAGFLREAVRLSPDDAEAWGLLALALRNIADYAPVERIDAAVADCQRAARQALRLEPGQADAEAALALLPPVHGDWFAAEARFREFLSRHPDHVGVLGALAVLLISVGRIRDGALFNLRAAEIEPLSPVYQYRRAYHQLFVGDVAGADRTIDRASQLWPRHPAVWYARLLIRGLSGRADAALRLLDDAHTGINALPPAAVRQWTLAMRATLAPDAALRLQAISASFDAARRALPASVNAVLLLNLLGALDEAFAVTDGYLLNRGPLSHAEGPAKQFINDQRWKKTMMLFTPTAAPMRADPRFVALCDEMGMAEYWRRVRHQPDYRRLVG